MSSNYDLRDPRKTLKLRAAKNFYELTFGTGKHELVIPYN